MAASQRHSKSAAASNKAASLLQCSLGLSLACCQKHVLDTTTEGIYFRTRSDDRLFNLSRLRAKTKVREVLIRDMLFADDAAVATHTQEEHQSLMDCFSHACKHFGLTISLKKTNAWDRTHKHRRLLAFMTTNSMLSASSSTAAPPSLTSSLWTQRSTRGLGRKLQLSLVARLECGQAPSCL